MPVTAKLSRRFYEKLGDEIANELVDWLNKVDQELRTDARAIADDYYLRFDSRLGQETARLEAKLAQETARLEAGIAEAEKRFERRLGDVRADLIKWMFIFWAGSTVATVTLVVTFVGLLIRWGSPT